MSKKTRILVEGKDDRAIMRNLLSIFGKSNEIGIDVAADLKGTCKITALNNRAKVEKIHTACRDSIHHRQLYFFCDREFRKFRIENAIFDEASEHNNEGNLFWTLGHSIENYFLSEDILIEAYRFLCLSGHKNDASLIFQSILNQSIRLIAQITFAAKEINKSGYPLSIISWTNISIDAEEKTIKIIRDTEKKDRIHQEFWREFDKCSKTIDESDYFACVQFCRGHTAMLIMRNIFAACIYKAASSSDIDIADREANLFFNLSENVLASALSEAWLKRVKNGVPYPKNLINII